MTDDPIILPPNWTYPTPEGVMLRNLIAMATWVGEYARNDPDNFRANCALESLAMAMEVIFQKQIRRDGTVIAKHVLALEKAMATACNTMPPNRWN